MVKFKHILAFMQILWEQEEIAHQAAHIIHAILKARSLRITEIAAQMRGGLAANYKAIQRFLAKVDPREILWRLYQTQAPFVIGDVTEIPRPQARRTPYVGFLKDGKTRGFWLLMLATSFRGRALPFAFLTYSSSTIAQESSSRNLYHYTAIESIKELVGDTPLVFDREFSYLDFLKYLSASGLRFVIRLHLRSNPPEFVDRYGEKVALNIMPGEKRVIPNVLYKGEVKVHLVGVWRQGFKEPLWLMTNVDPRRALEIYRARMKIEESFRDLKSLLGLDRVMNKKQVYMEKMVALLLIAYAVGMLMGEVVRDALYGGTAQGQRKWRCYSGLFILLKQKPRLDPLCLRQLVSSALESFAALVHPPPVRTLV